MNKKGISAVVANVLIVLLVVAGVVLLWSAVRPTIEQAGEQVGAECVTVDLEVIGCNITTEILTVRRNSGSGDLSGARLIIGDETTDCNAVADVEQLASVMCNVTESGDFFLDTGNEVQVAAIISDGTVCNPLRSAYVC